MTNDYSDQCRRFISLIDMLYDNKCSVVILAESPISTLCQIANLSKDYSFKLSNKTLGIIGVGNVGRRLEVKAKQLGMKTLLNDPPRGQPAPSGEQPYHPYPE